MTFGMGYFFAFYYRVVISNIVNLTCHPGRVMAIEHWTACTQCGNAFESFDRL